MMRSPPLTGTEWKIHLQHLREQRQQQLHSTIDECQRLQQLHKELFHRQWQPNAKFTRTKDQARMNTSILPVTPDHRKARRDYTFLIDQRLSSDIDEHQSLIHNSKSLTSLIPSSSHGQPMNQVEAKLPSRSSETQRPLSVSTVDSEEKRAHKVYEKWPDYEQISQIVGFRIDPPKPKVSMPTESHSTTKKRNSSSRLVAATKQIKTIVNLNVAATRRMKTTEPIPEQPLMPPVGPMMIHFESAMSAVPRLPSSFCPSSMIYSQRIRTRQWLLKTNFAEHAMRTSPLF